MTTTNDDKVWAEEMLNRTGFTVDCAVCGMRKAPAGRSLPSLLAGSYCTWECDGYYKDPQPDYLFPNESVREFGFGAEYEKAEAILKAIEEAK